MLALAILVLTFFFLGAGNHSHHADPLGRLLGLAAAACALYLALAELCEASYDGIVRPVWPLTKR